MTSLITADGRLLKRTEPANGRYPLLSTFDGVWTDRTDAEDTERRLISFAQIYDCQPVVAAAINKLTRQGSTLPLKVYQREANNERTRLTDHPLARLLSKPVPRAGAVQLKQWIFMPLLTHGNALIAKYRENPDGPPTALLPVDWRFVEAYAARGGPVEVWATMQTGERRWVDVEDTIHVAWQSPCGEIGTSPLAQLRTTIQVEDAAQRYGKAMFKNSARPTGAITTPEGVTLDKDIRGEMRRDLERLYQGIDNAGRPALLPGGVKWEPMAHTAHEAELINQRYVDWEEIQMIFDLPGPLLADLRHGTYSNVSELNLALYKIVLRPWLTLIEETIQAHLIDPEPDWLDIFVEFDMGEVLKGNPLELANAIKTQIDAGVMTRNEGRKLLNLPRDQTDGADQLFFPANNQTPLDAVPPDGSAPPQLP